MATFVADAVDAYRAAFADADVASASSGSSLAESDRAAEAAGRAAMLASLVEAGFPVLAPLLPMARRLAPAFSEATDWSKVEPWLWILIAASCPAGWGTSASLEPDFSLAYPAGVSLVIDCLVRACADVGLPFLAAIDTRCFATTTNGMMDKLPRFDCVRDDSEHSGGRACIGLVLAIALGIDEPAAFRLAVCIVQAGVDAYCSCAAAAAAQRRASTAGSSAAAMAVDSGGSSGGASAQQPPTKAVMKHAVAMTGTNSANSLVHVPQAGQSAAALLAGPAGGMLEAHTIFACNPIKATRFEPAVNRALALASVCAAITRSTTLRTAELMAVFIRMQRECMGEQMAFWEDSGLYAAPRRGRDRRAPRRRPRHLRRRRAVCSAGWRSGACARAAVRRAAYQPARRTRRCAQRARRAGSRLPRVAAAPAACGGVVRVTVVSPRRSALARVAP